MNQILLYIFPALMAFAACSDLLTMRISNSIVLATLAGFVVVAYAVGLPPAVIGMHLGIGAIALLATFAMFAFGWIGGGDAKLAAAIVAWMGMDLALPYLLHAAVLGGVLTLAILLARRCPLPLSVTRVNWIGQLHDSKGGVPYGIALAAAALLVYPQSPVFDQLTVGALQGPTFEQLQTLSKS